jgi:hypothetical protein
MEVTKGRAPGQEKAQLPQELDRRVPGRVGHALDLGEVQTGLVRVFHEEEQVGLALWRQRQRDGIDAADDRPSQALAAGRDL